ncbi:unnamed protein product [Polarella glacialis]|uniref:RWD domain-containing protein n=1 Tax=Polarella glacialis TaxID=89957 RepID=A0A813GS96_POLGL|nr:unnamed protein product [Polarella glacialis]
MDENVVRQLSEIEALQAIFGDEFELLEEPREGRGAAFRLRCPPPVGLLLVSLPPGYPSDGTSIPVFTVEGLRGEDCCSYCGCYLCSLFEVGSLLCSFIVVLILVLICARYLKRQQLRSRKA